MAINGSPGFGKSSLLKYLITPETWREKGQDPSLVFFVYLNCTDINPFTPSAFWRELLNILKSKTDGHSGLQSEIIGILNKPEVEKNDLRLVLQKVGSLGKSLLLALDDYDVALHENPNYTESDMLTFLYEFRNLAVHNDEGCYLSIIVTSFRRLNELGPVRSPSGSPWYNHYSFQLLRPYSTDEVQALFDRMPPEWELSLFQRNAIREMTGDHPALVQHACHRLFRRFRDEQDLRIDTDQFTRGFLEETAHYFSDAWDFSTNEEKLPLMLIALSNLEGRLNRKQQYKLTDVARILSHKEKELRDLEARGILRHHRVEGKDNYSFASPVMEWWVIKEIENCEDEVHLEQMEKVFFNLSRKQVEQIKNVMHQVWQQKEGVKAIVSFIGELVRAFQGIPDPPQSPES